MERPRILGVIPARLNSSRLPGKVLRMICGKPMVQHVYERAATCHWLDELVVATDSLEVQSACQGAGIAVCLTSPRHTSGSDRVYEVATQRDAELIVNIQGDEPLLHATHIDALIQPFVTDPFLQVCTLRVAITPEQARDPNNVKVVCGRDGYALYFSRAMIPHERDAGGGTTYYKHLGFYAYNRRALCKFCRLAPSQLEQCEKLEQLRFLENGIRLRVAEAPYDTVGVDTEEDLAKVEMLMQRRAA